MSRKTSVRLTERDDEIIAALRRRWGVDQSGAIRRALRLAGQPLQTVHQGSFEIIDGETKILLRVTGWDIDQ